MQGQHHSAELLYYIILNTVTYGHALFTFYGEVDSLRRHSSFIHGDALVPAGLIRAHRGHLERQVGQHVHSRIHTGVVASSQPGEVEVDGADNVACEDGAGARGHRDVSLHCDGRRGLCGKKAEAIDQSVNQSIYGWIKTIAIIPSDSDAILKTSKVRSDG